MPQRLSEVPDSWPELTTIIPDESISHIIEEMEPGDTIKTTLQFDIPPHNPLPENEQPPWATNKDKITLEFLREKLHYTRNDENEYQAKGEHGSILWRTDWKELRVYVNGMAAKHLTQKNVYHLARGLEIGLNR